MVDCTIGPINIAGVACGEQLLVNLANFTTGATAGTTWSFSVTGGGTLDSFDPTTGLALVTPTSSPMTFTAGVNCP